MSLESLDKHMAGHLENWEPPAEFPTKPIRLKGRKKNAGKVWTDLIRILDPDEALERDRRLAAWIGGNVADSMPRYRFWLALSTIRTMWRDLPKWLSWQIARDERLALDILGEVEKFEAEFRVEYLGESEENPEEGGFSISSGDDAEEGDPVGRGG